MKVFEILRNDTPATTEQQLIERLKAFDWKYEFSEDTRRVQKGAKELEILENMVYRLWKTSPDRAIQLWGQYSPGYDSKITPSFIFRLQAQDNP